MNDLDHYGLTDKQIETIRRFQKDLPGEEVDIIKLAKAFGCRVFEAKMPQNVSGAIVHDEDGDFKIYFSNKETKLRQRFTCAHELAHYLLHKESIQSKPLHENILLRSRLGNQQEVEANKLAADLLMPMDIIDHLTEEGDYDIQKLANIFGVSRQAMLVRLGIPDYRNYY